MEGMGCVRGGRGEDRVPSPEVPRLDLPRSVRCHSTDPFLMSTTPTRALVVDDESDVQFLFTQKFRREVRKGLLEFIFATSGEEALGKLRSGEAADVVVVLSDINMPGMSGLDLLATVTAEFPDKQVYMVTAYDDGQLEATALESGARGYLTKPIDFNSLKGEVFGLETA